MHHPLTVIKMAKKLCVLHGSILIGVGSASALSVSPFNRSEEYALQINIRQGTKELGAFNCLDVLSSNSLMSHKIKTIKEVSGNDQDIIEIGHKDDVNEDWSRIETLYNGAMNSVRCSEDNVETFRKKIETEIKTDLSEYRYAEQIYGYRGNITLEIPGQNDDINYLNYIFKMRNELLLEKQTGLFVETITEMLKVIPTLHFKENLFSDVFFNLADGKSKHFVTSKNFLFAINVAIQLHHRSFFQPQKEYFHCPAGYEPIDGRKYKEQRKFKEALVLNKPVWYILSVIDFDVNLNNEITDIVIRHRNETFGCGLRADGTLVLKPCFTFGEASSSQIASVFVVFDELGALKNITHLHAVCHKKMENNIQYFYYYLIDLLPRIVAIDLEESVYDYYPKSIEYSETKTILNTVLDFILMPNNNIYNRIDYVNIRGYNVLTDNNMNYLRNMSLISLGLFGNFLVKDYINAYSLLTTPCILSQSLSTFKGSPFCHRMLDEVCPDIKHEMFVFYMGHQEYTIPDKAFEGRAELYDKLKCYFIGQDFRKGVKLSQTGKNIKKMAILYKYYYYRIDPNNDEKIIMCEQTPEVLGEVENLIFTFYKADVLFLETKLYCNCEVNKSAVKTVIFNTSSNKNFDESYAKTAMKVLDQDQGQLLVLFGVKTIDETTELFDISNNIIQPLIGLFKATYDHKINKLNCFLKILTCKALRQETPNTIRNTFEKSIEVIRQNQAWFIIDFGIMPAASENSIENITLE
ncbi:hypothetical protein ENBRE01_0413 [Enteropsectra breve]|nr:hypothetical protein ENBRE01_0413 [Enteropsectra breve]